MNKAKLDTAVQGVLSFLEGKEDGVLIKTLVEQTMVHLIGDDRTQVIQHLLNSQKVKVFSDAEKNQYYKLNTQPPDTRLAGLSKEDIMVYQRIKEAGNKGIWTKDLKIQTNLAQPQLTKILKTLEASRLVKSIKGVAHPSRKLYILADIEPAREITGGAWYSDNQFDRQFVEVLREACYKRIAQGPPFPKLPDVAAFIQRSGISRVALQEDDIMQIIDTLIFDGRVDQIVGEEYDTFRPALLQIPEASALSSMPCGVCPVFDQCTDGGEVSPQSCVYFKSWLDF